MKWINSIQKFIRIRMDAITNQSLKRNLLNAIPFWTGALIAGGVSVLYAWLFSLAEQGTRVVYEHTGWAIFVLMPACFVLSWWLVNRYAPFARGSGIPQVSAAIELSTPRHYRKVDILLSMRIIFIKVLSSLVMVFGGGVIGREGPTIQITASIFKKINDMLPAWYPKISKRSMIVTGAAAGLASAFNTPLGGIVFAIEELTRTHFSYFKSALLTGVIIAGLTALNLLGPYLYIGYPQLSSFGFYILLPTILLAVFSGLSGSAMCELILRIFRTKRAFKNTLQNVLFLTASGLLLAALGFWFGNHALGSGKEIMLTTLFTDEKHLEWYVPILRAAGPVLSFSSGSSGGIFAPSLSAGASLGAVFAGWFHLSGTATNLLILCGMTGFLTSVTRSPFTSSILVLEMTNSHNVIFYLMLTALVANLAATMVNKHSFYDQLKDQYLHDILHSGTDKAKI